MSGTRHRPGWDAAESSASNGRRVLPHLASEFLALGGEVFAGTPTPERLHDLRLAGKRLRYSLELFRESYGPELESILRTLKKIQRMLGRISDCDATERLVRSTGLADAEGAAELLQAIKLDRNATTRMFLLRWRRFFLSTEAVEAWARALGDHAPGGPDDGRSSADLP